MFSNNFLKNFLSNNSPDSAYDDDNNPPTPLFIYPWSKSGKCFTVDFERGTCVDSTFDSVTGTINTFIVNLSANTDFLGLKQFINAPRLYLHSPTVKLSPDQFKLYLADYLLRSGIADKSWYPMPILSLDHVTEDQPTAALLVMTKDGEKHTYYQNARHAFGVPSRQDQLYITHQDFGRSYKYQWMTKLQSNLFVTAFLNINVPLTWTFETKYIKLVDFMPWLIAPQSVLDTVVVDDRTVSDSVVTNANRRLFHASFQSMETFSKMLQPLPNGYKSDPVALYMLLNVSDQLSYDEFLPYYKKWATQN